MKSGFFTILPVFTLGGLLALLTGCASPAIQQDGPHLFKASLRVVDEPLDLVVPVGSSVELTAPGGKNDLTTFQWYRGCDPLSGQTQNKLTFPFANTNDVGFYNCLMTRFTQTMEGRIMKEGPVFTRTVALITSSTNRNIITVPGLPVASSGNSGGTCPGPYVGYVNYRKSVAQGWGYVPIPAMTTYIATDPQSSTTKVEYVGYSGDHGCNTGSVTIPPQANQSPLSTKYRFTIYFKTGPVPTGNYNIQLTNFYP